MKVIVTCGPSYEPIDQVRRLTNFSTGELGVHLSNQLTRAGFEVFCLKGSGATYPGPADHCHLSLFDTNDNLLELLEQTSAAHEIAAVFHVAALCDYKVKRVEDDQGRSCNSPKIASRSGALTISLESATKVIAKMRHLFAESILVGWKYEFAGTPPEALAKPCGRYTLAPIWGVHRATCLHSELPRHRWRVWQVDWRVLLVTGF